jgi:hypothetical protein
MKTTATALCALVAAALLLALPATAAAEYLVPPGNSAVNQYTETYPSAGGQQQAGKGRHAAKHPAQVLGDGNAQKLDQQGADGRAAAELAAETAPGAASRGNNGGGKGSGQGEPSGGSGSGGGPSSGAGSEGESERGAASGAGKDAGDGSSGLGSVISQATGSSSSGELGLLLPLAILAAIAWSVAYLLRQRKRPTA